jgi:hypothetical protein
MSTRARVRVDSRALMRARRATRASNPRGRAMIRVASSSASSARVCVVGARSLTGRLIAGMLARRGGDGVALVVEDADSYVPRDMPEDVFERRFGTSAAAMMKCALVNENDDEAVERAMRASDVVIVAHESGARSEAAAASVRRGATKAKRVVALSRVGVNRRDENPFKEQNRPVQKMVKVGQMNLPIGGDVDGSKGLLDSYAAAEATLERGAKELGYALTVVRSGQLRGNGPLLLGDYSARLVDNMYDVKFQDLYLKRGDTSEGYTKRLNLAQFIAHVSTTRVDDAPDDVEVLSVVTKTNFFGEQSLTPPTDRERRKGYDMAKGKAPAAIDVEIIDALLAEI